jgi:bifunctional ADP-heptose synthase (sugar kinase/adenylyltransferase)
VLAAGPALLEATGNRAALVTRGALGMVLFRSGEPPVAIPAHGSDEVADVTGAGDTVIATFALAVAAGAPLPDAARLANVAAGLVVMKAGTATVTPDELRRGLTDTPA